MHDQLGHSQQALLAANVVTRPSTSLPSVLCRGNPNMNSLIGLGTATSFTAGTASLLLPGAGLEVGFMEEPVMLLAFVLLGRALETRARLKASGVDSVPHILGGAQHPCHTCCS